MFFFSNKLGFRKTLWKIWRFPLACYEPYWHCNLLKQSCLPLWQWCAASLPAVPKRPLPSTPAVGCFPSDIWILGRCYITLTCYSHHCVQSPSCQGVETVTLWQWCRLAVLTCNITYVEAQKEITVYSRLPGSTGSTVPCCMPYYISLVYAHLHYMTSNIIHDIPWLYNMVK